MGQTLSRRAKYVSRDNVVSTSQIVSYGGQIKILFHGPTLCFTSVFVAIIPCVNHLRQTGLSTGVRSRTPTWGTLLPGGDLRPPPVGGCRVTEKRSVLQGIRVATRPFPFTPFRVRVTMFCFEHPAWVFEAVDMPLRGTIKHEKGRCLFSYQGGRGAPFPGRKRDLRSAICDQRFAICDQRFAISDQRFAISD